MLLANSRVININTCNYRICTNNNIFEKSVITMGFTFVYILMYMYIVLFSYPFLLWHVINVLAGLYTCRSKSKSKEIYT